MPEKHNNQMVDNSVRARRGRTIQWVSALYVSGNLKPAIIAYCKL